MTDNNDSRRKLFKSIAAGSGAVSLLLHFEITYNPRTYYNVTVLRFEPWVQMYLA